MRRRGLVDRRRDRDGWHVVAELLQKDRGSTGANSAEALFAVDGNQRIVAWNGEATRMFGYAPEVAVGEECFRLVGAEDQRGRAFCRAGCPVVRAARHGEVLPTLSLSAPTSEGQKVAVNVSTIVLVLGSKAGMIIHLCRQAGAETGSRPPGGTIELTNRERQVLRALCRGCSTEAMAVEMNVSATTVRNHIQHLLAKLATHSRAEAVAIAYREGLNA